MRKLTIDTLDLPPARPFVIARGARTAVPVVRVTLTEGGISASGERRPNARYQAYPDGICRQLAALRPAIEAGMDREQLSRIVAARLGAQRAGLCTVAAGSGAARPDAVAINGPHAAGQRRDSLR